MVSLAPACLDAPPEYQAPRQIPPIITTGLVDPSTVQVHIIDEEQETIPFTVPFRSEDLGEPLRAVFVRNLDPTLDDFLQAGNIVTQPSEITPNTVPLEEQTEPRREVSATWSLVDSRPTGCTSVTMVLTYRENIEGFFQPTDETLAARVTWWFNFEPFGDCPPELEGMQ